MGQRNLEIFDHITKERKKKITKIFLKDCKPILKACTLSFASFASVISIRGFPEVNGSALVTTGVSRVEDDCVLGPNVACALVAPPRRAGGTRGEYSNRDLWTGLIRSMFLGCKIKCVAMDLFVFFVCKKQMCWSKEKDSRRKERKKDWERKERKKCCAGFCLLKKWRLFSWIFFFFF